MFRYRTEIGAAVMVLALTVAVSAAALAVPAEAAGMKRTITMVAVEPKGGTSVDQSRSRPTRCRRAVATF